MIAQVGNFTTAVSAAAVVFSIFYNWAYFIVIDKDILALFSLSDYITSSLAVFPLFSVSLVSGIYLSFSDKVNLEDDSSEADNIVIFDTENARFFVTALPWKNLLVLWVLYSIVPFIGPLSVAIYSSIIPFIFTWQRLYFTLFQADGGIRRIGDLSAIFYYAPILIMLAATYGSGNAYYDLTKKGEYSLRTVDNLVYSGVSLLRKTSEFTIIRDSESDAVVAVSNGTISELSRIREYQGVGLSCRWFGWLCQEK